MREDLVTPATARRLQRAGLDWEPQTGDWCIVLGGDLVENRHSGLWLVAAVAGTAGVLGVMDAGGQWPMAQVPTRECTWVPSAGKLKMWLRARGYRIATGEAEAGLLGTGARHVCRLSGPGAGGAPVDGEGSSESEAVAEVALRVLAQQERAAGHDPAADGVTGPAVAYSDLPTRRL